MSSQPQLAHGPSIVNNGVWEYGCSVEQLEEPYKVIGKSWSFLSQALLIQLVFPRPNSNARIPRRYPDFFRKGQKVSLSSITWEHQIFCFPPTTKGCGGCLQTQIFRMKLSSTWISPLLSPTFTLPSFLSCHLITPSSRSPVWWPHLPFRNLCCSSLEFPPLFFPAFWTEVSQALQTPKGKKCALNLCVEQIESTLIQFPYQQELWLISSGPKKQAHSSKQAFISTLHSPPAKDLTV